MLNKSQHTQPIVSEPILDRSLMCVAAVISTGDVDRSQDTMRPEGCILTNYERNPVVGWNHFLDFSMPIGTSRGPDGKLHVTVKKTGIIAKCFFSQRLKEAAQVFELVDEGIIRATSIGWHFVEGKAKVRSRPEFSDRPGLAFEEWELVEWSFVPVGDNPNALALDSETAGKCARIISTGMIGGSEISPVLVKTVASMAEKRKVMSNGVSFTNAGKNKRTVIENPIRYCEHVRGMYGADQRTCMRALRNLKRQSLKDVIDAENDRRKSMLRRATKGMLKNG